MLDRLLGQETEYAIRASRLERGAADSTGVGPLGEEGAPGRGPGSPGEPIVDAPGERSERWPGNLTIYRAVVAVLREQTKVGAGRKVSGLESVFLENGGSICYEVMPHNLSAGLIEGATPECRSPSELLVYQQAQERLLSRAVRRVAGAYSDALSELALIKNCRDFRGNIYGAQENYEAVVATGAWLWVYRASIAALLPCVVAFTLLMWLVLASFLVGFLSAGAFGLMLYLLIPRLRGHLQRITRDDERLERGLARALFPFERIVVIPLMTPCALAMRLLAFRRVRRTILGFLVTRPILSGAGTVDGDRFGLSEKGPAMRRVMRAIATARSRSIFDSGNLLKAFMAPAALQLRPLLDLFRRRQRMQLGLSDANRAQIAEYLKVATTSLVLDMAEEGYLDDGPRPRRPVRALHAVVGDPTLEARVALHGGRELTALELQRWYLERAEQFIEQSPTPSLEARDVVRLWRQCVETLEADPGALVGRLDWVTKRWLLERAAADAPLAVRQKIDIGYHELDSGYFAQIERAGLAPRLVSDEEVERAICEPPERGPARQRGRLIRHLAAHDKVVVDWKSVRIGGRIRGKVIRLDDHRE